MLRDGLNQQQMDAFGCMVQGSFLTYRICTQQAVTVVEAVTAEIHCFKKKFTLLLFAITKSGVDRFQ